MRSTASATRRVTAWAPLPDHTLPARTLRFDDGPPGRLYQRVDGSWTPLDGDDAISVAAGVPLLLRIGSQSGDLEALAQCGTDDAQARCLAANDAVDDDALRHLSSPTDLRTLDLTRTRVTDAGLDRLPHLTQLQQLNLSGTDTTPRPRTPVEPAAAADDLGLTRTAAGRGHRPAT